MQSASAQKEVVIHRALPVLSREPGVPYCCSHFPLCTHLLNWSSLSAVSLLVMKHFLPASQSAFSSATQTSAGCAHAPGCMLTPRCHMVLAGTDITYDQSLGHLFCFSDASRPRVTARQLSRTPPHRNAGARPALGML